MTISTIKIVSYNIHKGFSSPKGGFVLPQIRQALHDINPDLIFLQEVQGKHKKSKLKKVITPDNPEDIPQAEFLAEEVYAHYIYGKNAVYGPAHHGNALLSKFPFIMWDNINVSLSSRASRSLLHGVIEMQQQPVHIICIHLGLFKAERKIQLSLLSDRIKAHVADDEPLIIAGDFNDWRGMAENHLEAELQMQEVYKTCHGNHAKTYPAMRPAFRVDRIYYRGFGVRKAATLNELPWKKLSDHVPLYAELVLQTAS